MNAHGFGMSSNVEVSASIHIRVFFFFLNGGGRVAGSVEGADGDVELQFASKLVLPLGLIT